MTEEIQSVEDIDNAATCRRCGHLLAQHMYADFHYGHEYRQCSVCGSSLHKCADPLGEAS